jgi:translation initiation factor IF-2
LSKRRVHEIAKELGISSKELLDHLHRIGIEAKTASSSVEDAVISLLKKDGIRPTAPAAPAEPPPPPPAPARPAPPAPPPPAAAPEPAPAEPAPPGPAAEQEPAGTVVVHHGVTVKEFAEKAGVAPAEVVKTLMRQGSMKTVTQSMSDEEILVVADELGIDVDVVDPDVEEKLAVLPEPAAVAAAAPEDLEERPPVVTVMGHVDHGKTTVLDKIRQANVVAGEAGGITQHIGAYQVEKDGNRITFIDTPGHEAFTAMRARGAQVTDVAVLVVAADDGVMPQTVEAIDHARAAHVPIIVAVNKIDKAEADPLRVRTELSEHGLQPQEWGGDTLFVDLSAREGTNLEDLLTAVALVAEELGLKAVAKGPARGIVLEAHLDKGRGPVATVLVQRGTLKVGDAVVAGAAWGKVRALVDEYGTKVDEAPPSRPVLALGWNSVPQAGDEARVVSDERQARQLAQERDAARRQAELVASRRAVSLEELFGEGGVSELNLILKGDVHGSVEALADALGKLDVADARINIIHRGVGGITENDVSLAKASDAIIVGFNVRPDVKAREAADAEGVDIRSYRVIYQAIEEIEQALKGLLAPEEREYVLGSAEVRQVFKIPRGMAAGCYVTNGEIRRNAQARLLREGVVVFEGAIASLRRVKDDVRQVAQGFECGIVLEGFSDVKVGDVIESFEIREIPRG